MSSAVFVEKNDRYRFGNICIIYFVDIKRMGIL